MQDQSDDNSAQIWHNAQYRRAADIMAWLHDFLERRRKMRAEVNLGNVPAKPSRA